MISKDKNKSNVTNRLQLPSGGGNRTTAASTQPRYTHIAPRPIAPSQPGARQSLLQPKPIKFKQPSGRRTNKERKKPAAKKATTTKTTATTTTTTTTSMPPPSTVPVASSTNIVEPSNNNPFVFDAEDDKFIQELLAGIPSSGATWLPPTDPLTSESWFPDPASSVITQDSLFQPPSTTTTATVGNLEAAAANANNKQTPDGRLMATLRSTTTKTTPLRSSSNSKRHNPLNGFAKKHGVGYPVGNQLALVSPALLSSSPPSAHQLRKDPYKFYSPPQKQHKQQSVSSSQSSTKQQEGEKKRQKDTINNNIKWEISQDKLLLRGVRQQRWLLNGKQYSPGALVDAREPSQFTTSDWEYIAKGVSKGAGKTRTAKQCRRRWAMIHMHLGTSIMDFVDSKPTPQSSTRTTPAANQVGGGPVASRNAVRNLRLAELPHSSPPIPRPPPAATSKPSKEPEPKQQTSEILVGGNLDMEKRWEMPLYCQLLADVVQAISDPQSQAAQVARKHGAVLPAGVNESGKEIAESVLSVQPPPPPPQQQQQQQNIATPVIDNIDQDLDVYMQFLQSLTNDQLENMDNNAWNTLFSDPATAMTTTIDANTAPAPVEATATISNKQTAAKGDEDDASDDDFILDEADLDEEEDDDDDGDDENEEEKRKRVTEIPAANNGWDLSLEKLMDGESSSLSMNMLSPDPLIQQLMQNVADMGQENDNQQSAWLPNATDPAIMAATGAGSTDLSSALVNMTSTDKQRVPPSSASKLQPTFSTIGMGSAVQRTTSHPADTMMTMMETDSPADLQSSVQQPTSGTVTLKTPTSISKKRGFKKKAAASSSIVQALSEAAMQEPSYATSGDIDTEMSGLYQDALQEGEVLDVQEEALVADSSEFLFLKEQMDQLRQQQLLNFQFVVQAYMIGSRHEDGPHSEQARYWKSQLDQLLLWDSLGTNPTSFFAIPGIRVVVPELYAAMDEMHRATMSVPKNNSSKNGNQKQKVVRSYVVAGGRVEVSEECQCTVVDRFGCSMMTQRVLPEVCAKIRYHNHLNLGSKKRKKSLPPPVGEEDTETDDVNIPPLTTPYTPAEEREAIEKMRAQIRAFRKDVHRVPKPRRRILVQGEDGVPRLDWITVKVVPVVLPPAMQSILNMIVESQGCSQWLLPQIMVVKKPKNRIHFMDSEDALLLQGLRLFGLEDIASMRVHLMPTKTASQLRNRLSNLRARRAPPNAVKEFYLRRIQPFTLEEEEILRVGVLVYGDEFGQVNSDHQNFLINRPILALTNVLNHVKKKSAAAITDDKKSQQSFKSRE